MGWGAISVPHPRSRECLAHQDTVAQKKTTLLLRFLSTPAGADRGFQSGGGGEIFEEQKKIKIGTKILLVKRAKIFCPPPKQFWPPPERKSDKKCSYLLIAGWSAFPFL